MTHIAICDDESAAQQDIVRNLFEIFTPEMLKLQIFSGGKALLDAVEDGSCRPDIVFLDIVLEDSFGIGVAKKLNLCCPECSIIFVTGYLHFALDVYDVRHSYFILKSQLETRLPAAVEKVLSDRRSSPSINFRDNGVIHKILLKKVLYFERSLKKTIINLLSGESYCSAEKPSELLHGIQDSGFIQCHQSYFVNLIYVSSMSPVSFTLIDGTEIPISRSQHSRAKEAFLASFKMFPACLL